jgi:methylase of polypeptide subunit release factors
MSAHHRHSNPPYLPDPSPTTGSEDDLIALIDAATPLKP